MFAFFKRIFVFMLVNALVVITLSLVLNLLGIRPYLTAYGMDYESLMGFCLVWGMGGAFISLQLSRIIAKFAMGVQVIDPQTRDPQLQDLIQSVYNLCRGAGLSKMPEVGIYDSPEINAFATGPSKSRSLVAVSSGLLSRLRQDEVEGVLAHEVAHIANGDMVTMTLVQGVVNAFVMFMARAIAFAVAQLARGERDRDGGVNYLVYNLCVFFFEILFMILGSMVVAYFSRIREFRADAGGSKLAGRDKMVGALRALQRTFEIVDPATQKPAFQAMKISNPGRAKWLHLFSTHPPLEERIARLESSL